MQCAEHARDLLNALCRKNLRNAFSKIHRAQDFQIAPDLDLRSGRHSPMPGRRTTQAFSFCNQCIVLVRSPPVSYLLSCLTTLSTAIPETKSHRCQLLNMNTTKSKTSLFSYNNRLQANGIHTQVNYSQKQANGNHRQAKVLRMASIRRRTTSEWHPSAGFSLDPILYIQLY